MVPDVGSRPASTSISVVLPEPLAPVTATCSPASTVRSTGRERVVVGVRVAESDVVAAATGTGATARPSVRPATSSLCTSGMPRSRSITRDSAHQPISEMTTMMDITE